MVNARTDSIENATVRVEAALFPIPDVVAFPGMVVPLHVFEPRTRQDPEFKSGGLQAIHSRIIDLVRLEFPDLVEDLENREWTELDPNRYSLRIFRCLRLDPDLMQTILESRSAGARLEMIWAVLHPD